jgi:MFS family permease
MSLTRGKGHRAGTFAALRSQSFRLLWIAMLISNIGTWLQVVAQDLLVYDLTHRALDLGYVYLARAVAIVMVSFIGGALSDRWDKRKLLMTTQVVYAAISMTLGMVVYFGVVQVWHVIVASFLSAMLQGVEQPSRQALVPHLVKQEHLPNALALNSLVFALSAAVGPAIAGPLVSVLGMSWGFFLNALSFVAVFGAVWSMKLSPVQGVPTAESLGTQMLSGLRYVVSRSELLLLLSLLMVFGFFAFPYQAMLPVFVRTSFGGGISQFGYLRAAPGVGALIGSFLLAHFSEVPYKGWLMVGAGVGFIAAVITFSATSSFGLALLLICCASLLFTVFQTTLQTLLQLNTTDSMRGRVMGLWAIGMIGMWSLGTLPLSWAADHYGVAMATAGSALIAGLYAIVVAFAGRRVITKLG